VIAVIDCGTTNTRIYIVSDEDKIIASGAREIGVRNTVITGSRDALKNGIEQLFSDILKENKIMANEIIFAIASGMITSEIGLIEIPHIVAPVGIEELSKNIKIVNDPAVLDIGVPLYFVRGVRNDYGENPTLKDIAKFDFLRGEEVQCMGILNEMKPSLPLNIVVLSSHTKIIHLDRQGKIARCMTTISGQFYNALKDATNIGKSIVPVKDEKPGGYSYEEIIEIAKKCVERAGLNRTMFMPRLMQVLLETSSDERILFTNAAIAVDDIKTFMEFRSQGYDAENYLFFGHGSRCKLYSHLIRQEFGKDIKIESIYDEEIIAKLTVEGSIAVAGSFFTR
jgi:2-dehydro-3-deoxygalactonokinase